MGIASRLPYDWDGNTSICNISIRSLYGSDRHWVSNVYYFVCCNILSRWDNKKWRIVPISCYWINDRNGIYLHGDCNQCNRYGFAKRSI